jgi:hypothetical protein
MALRVKSVPINDLDFRSRPTETEGGLSTFTVETMCLYCDSVDAYLAPHWLIALR